VTKKKEYSVIKKNVCLVKDSMESNIRYLKTRCCLTIVCVTLREEWELGLGSTSSLSNLLLLMEYGEAVWVSDRVLKVLGRNWCYSAEMKLPVMLWEKKVAGIR
jgi:hypothetical protein